MMTTPQLSQYYFDQIAFRESGGVVLSLNSLTRYGKVNPYNYLGKYQMGTAAKEENDI